MSDATIRLKIGEMWAIPDDNKYYSITSMGGGISNFSGYLYQVAIMSRGNVADIDLVFFYEETGIISAGNCTATLSETVNGTSTDILSVSGNFIVSSPYEKIVGADATELKLIKVTVRSIPFVLLGTLSKLSGLSTCLVMTMDQRYANIPAHSETPAKGSYYYTDAKGNRI